jgi:cytochrome P450
MEQHNTPPIPTLRGLAAWRASFAFAANPIDTLETYTRRHGPVIQIARSIASRNVTPPAVVLVGPAYNRQVLLATEYLRPTGIWPVRGRPRSAQSNLRATYLTTHGAEHACFSGAVAPLLERPVVQKHYEAVKRIAAAEIAAWPIGRVVDIYRLARDLAQHYAFALLFGESDLRKCRHFGTLLASYHAINWSVLARLLPIDLPGSQYRRVLRQAERLQGFLMAWMKNSSRSLALNVRSAIGSVPGVSPERAAAHAAGFALASYETTATTLTWALLLLACHPKVQTALRAELEAAGPITELDIARLDALPLLDGVIRETLRLIAPVPFLGFKVINEWQVAGLSLNRDALLIISPHMTHRMPELYDQPRRFLPERWLRIRPTAYEFLPFSGGPRRCPGYLFAQNNLKVALATILTRFGVSVLPHTRIDRGYAAITVAKAVVPVHLTTAGSEATVTAPLHGTFFNLVDLPAP